MILQVEEHHFRMIFRWEDLLGSQNSVDLPGNGVCIFCVQNNIFLKFVGRQGLGDCIGELKLSPFLR